MRETRRDDGGFFMENFMENLWSGKTHGKTYLYDLW
jgi:hypothetical protein